MKLLIPAFRLLIPGQGMPGGNFFHVVNLTNSLVKLDDLDVVLATDADTGKFFNDYVDKVNLRIYPDKEVSTYKSLNLLMKSIKDSNPDIVHKMVGQLPFKKINQNKVVSIADLNFTVLKTPLIKKIYKEISYRNTLRQADAVTCVSEYTAMCVNKKFPRFSKKVSVVPHGTTPMNKNKIENVSRFKNYWITFGHRKHKNVELALQALGAIKKLKKLDRHNLVIVGSGSYIENYIKPMVVELGISTNVEIFSNLSFDELSNLYYKAKGLIFVSKYEGFGLPVLEAMGCGIPVICSNVCSLPEIVNGAGLMVGVNDDSLLVKHMLNIDQDDRLRRELIQNGIKRAATYSWDNSAKLTFEVYKGLIRKKEDKK